MNRDLRNAQHKQVVASDMPLMFMDGCHIWTSSFHALPSAWGHNLCEALLSIVLKETQYWGKMSLKLHWFPAPPNCFSAAIVERIRTDYIMNGNSFINLPFPQKEASDCFISYSLPFPVEETPITKERSVLVHVTQCRPQLFLSEFSAFIFSIINGSLLC